MLNILFGNFTDNTLNCHLAVPQKTSSINKNVITKGHQKGIERLLLQHDPSCEKAPNFIFTTYNTNVYVRYDKRKNIY